MKLRTLLKFKKKDRFNLLVLISRWLVPEYRFNWPYLDWWHDPVFNRYLEKFNELKKHNTERRLMLYQLMRLVDDIPGDTVECGTLRGAGSYLMCMMNEHQSQHRRHHHVFDSFEGLSQPGATDGAHWRKGDLAVTMEKVAANLERFDEVTLHKGWIPERFHEVGDKRFAFIHIDVDLYQPTLDSIDFFYPRTNEGGVILCDDYGSSLCPGATRAIDEYLANKPEKMIYLPGGGGFLIKGVKTSPPLTAS